MGRLGLVFLWLLLPLGAQSQDLDPRTGLIRAPGWQLVTAHCGACHSYLLITAQRGDATFWLESIRWMQRTQNLWPIPAEQETAIVTYLATNYNETEWGRRPPLSPILMPPAQPEAGDIR